MTGSVVGGVAASVAGLGAWKVTLVSSILAVSLSLVADILGLRPAGPFFGLFAFPTMATVPYQGRLAEAALATAATVTFLVVLAWTALTEGPATPRVELLRPRPPRTRQAMAVRAVRYALAVGAAGSVATAAGLGHHHWAMLAATAPLATADVTGGLNRATYCLLGICVGIGLTVVLLIVDWSPMSLAVLLALLLCAGETSAARRYSMALVFLTPVPLLMTHVVHITPTSQLVVDRATETVIGLAAALGVLLTTARSRVVAVGTGMAEMDRGSAVDLRPMACPRALDNVSDPWVMPRDQSAVPNTGAIAMTGAVTPHHRPPVQKEL